MYLLVTPPSVCLRSVTVVSVGKSPGAVAHEVRTHRPNGRVGPSQDATRTKRVIQQMVKRKDRMTMGVRYVYVAWGVPARVWRCCSLRFPLLCLCSRMVSEVITSVVHVQGRITWH